jgi:hypothetical protein
MFQNKYYIISNHIHSAIESLKKLRNRMRLDYYFCMVFYANGEIEIELENKYENI